MRPSAREITEAVLAYQAARKVTTSLIHQLVAAVAQNLANEMDGPVRVVLPGEIVIQRTPQEVSVKHLRYMRA